MHTNAIVIMTTNVWACEKAFNHIRTLHASTHTHIHTYTLTRTHTQTHTHTHTHRHRHRHTHKSPSKHKLLENIYAYIHNTKMSQVTRSTFP